MNTGYFTGMPDVAVETGPPNNNTLGLVTGVPVNNPVRVLPRRAAHYCAHSLENAQR